jgi:hypothetical protein
MSVLLSTGRQHCVVSSPRFLVPACHALSPIRRLPITQLTTASAARESAQFQAAIFVHVRALRKTVVGVDTENPLHMKQADLLRE